MAWVVTLCTAAIASTLPVPPDVPRAVVEALAQEVSSSSEDAPNLVPIRAVMTPPRPQEETVVLLAVTVRNDGVGPAQSAAIDVTDRRPSGDFVLLDTMALPGPLSPGDQVVLEVRPFLAIELGDHTLRVQVRDIVPGGGPPLDNFLDIGMTIVPAVPAQAEGPETGPTRLRTVAASLIALIALVAATAAILSRAFWSSDPKTGEPGRSIPGPVGPLGRSDGVEIAIPASRRLHTVGPPTSYPPDPRPPAVWPP